MLIPKVQILRQGLAEVADFSFELRWTEHV